MPYLYYLFLWSTILLTAIECDNSRQERNVLHNWNRDIAVNTWLTGNWSSRISTNCLNSLTKILHDSKKGFINEYADATATLPAGLLQGTVSSFGDYDQCLEIHEEQNSNLNGKYCILKIRLRAEDDLESDASGGNLKSTISSKFPIHLGVCLPKGCQDDDVRSLFEEAIPASFASISPETIFCDTKQSMSILSRLSSFRIFPFIFITGFICFVWLSTWMTFFSRDRDAWFKHFSLVRNFKHFLSPPDEKRRQFDYVDDMRFAVAIGVTAIHSYACGLELRILPKMFRLDTDFYSKFSWLSLQGLFNVVGIEVFFCLAGMATVWSTKNFFSQKVTAKGVGNLILFRWLRLGPVVLVLMAWEFVWPLIGDGPLFSEMTSFSDSNCKKNWWKNLLLISNYDAVTDICLVHVWYLSAEFQLFILGVISLIALKMSDAYGKILCSLMIFMGMAIPGYKSYSWGYDPAFLVTHTTTESLSNFTSSMYFPTYCHFTPFFMGLLAAYCVQTNQVSIDQLKRYRKTCAILYLGFLVVGHFPAVWNTLHIPVDHVTAGLYSLLHRFVYTLGLMSLTLFSGDLYVWTLKLVERQVSRNHRSNNNNDNNNSLDRTTANGTKDKVSVFAESMKMSRIAYRCSVKLNFSLYLVHSIFIRFDWFTSRSLFTFTVIPNAVRGTYSVILSLMWAFLFYLYFERPLENFRQVLKEKYVTDTRQDLKKTG